MTDELEGSDEPDGRFPLTVQDKPKIEAVIELVRSQLQFMTPDELRSAATVLLALERLPATTPGVHINFGFKIEDGQNVAWADIQFEDDEFRLGIGQHVFSLEEGGDTESKIVFEAFVGGDREGDIGRWLARAVRIAEAGIVSSEDYSDHDDLDWSSEDEPASWEE